MPPPWQPRLGIPLGYVDIPIETAGKRGFRRAQAKHLSAAARLKIATTAWRSLCRPPLGLG